MLKVLRQTILLLALSVSAVLVALVVPTPGFAEDLTDEKKSLIDDLLRVTGASNLGEMMATTFVGQMTDALKQAQPDLDPKAYDIIAEEVNQLIHEEVSERNALNDMMYPIYHRHLLTSDIEELIRFYQTPVGRKVIETMPIVFQESTLAGQQWGESLGPEIQRRIIERFDKEGIELK